MYNNNNMYYDIHLRGKGMLIDFTLTLNVGSLVPVCFFFFYCGFDIHNSTRIPVSLNTTFD